MQCAGGSRRRRGAGRADRNRKSPPKPGTVYGEARWAGPKTTQPSRCLPASTVLYQPVGDPGSRGRARSGQRRGSVVSTCLAPPRAFPAPVALTSSLGGFSWVFPNSPMARRSEPLWPLPASRPPSPRPGALGQPPGRGWELKRGRRSKRPGRQKCACAGSLTTHAHSCPGRSCVLRAEPRRPSYLPMGFQTRERKEAGAKV